MTTTPTLDPEFASAIREELVAIGTKKSRLQRRQRHTRILAVGIVAVGVAAATTGAAVASNYGGLTTVTPAGTPVTVTHTGTATIDLGPAVKGANSVIVDLQCVSGTGRVSVPLTPDAVQDRTGKVVPPTGPGATEFNCGTLANGVRVADGYLAAGSTSITITVDAGTTWRATAQYGTATTTDWGINAHGQTYGAYNKKNGEPDLIPAQATNGAVGYIYVKELRSFQGSGYLNVYESDGTTTIGKFPIGNVGDQSYTFTTDPPTAPAG